MLLILHALDGFFLFLSGPPPPPPPRSLIEWSQQVVALANYIYSWYIKQLYTDLYIIFSHIFSLYRSKYYKNENGNFFYFTLLYKYIPEHMTCVCTLICISLSWTHTYTYIYTYCENNRFNMCIRRYCLVIQNPI